MQFCKYYRTKTYLDRGSEVTRADRNPGKPSVDVVEWCEHPHSKNPEHKRVAIGWMALNVKCEGDEGKCVLSEDERQIGRKT